jgi:hypothetical protein
LNQFRIKENNHWLQVFETFENQRTAGSGYFINFKESSGFVKELAKDWTVLGGYLNFFETHGYV